MQTRENLWLSESTSKDLIETMWGRGGEELPLFRTTPNSFGVMGSAQKEVWMEISGTQFESHSRRRNWLRTSLEGNSTSNCVDTKAVKSCIHSWRQRKSPWSISKSYQPSNQQARRIFFILFLLKSTNSQNVFLAAACVHQKWGRKKIKQWFEHSMFLATTVFFLLFTSETVSYLKSTSRQSHPNSSLHPRNHVSAQNIYFQTILPSENSTPFAWFTQRPDCPLGNLTLATTLLSYALFPVQTEIPGVFSCRHTGHFWSMQPLPDFFCLLPLKEIHCQRLLKSTHFFPSELTLGR